ncbi:MAG: hypothetical protein IZT59_09940 [Verrucomicrobia bacterium]|nr:hypothetical protein [Verrucomicrobiota bacterium]
MILNFSNFSQDGPPTIGTTRTFTFRHNVFTGSDDDAVAVSGDSGSPTFADGNGKPALVGVHLAASQGTFDNSTSDTFVLHYAETVNGLLASSGYQLIPAFPDAVTLSSAATHDPFLQSSPAARTPPNADWTTNSNFPKRWEKIHGAKPCHQAF